MAALNILGIGDEQQGNLLGIPGAQVLDISPPTQAGQGDRPVEQRDALAGLYNNVTDYIRRERQRSSDMGLWNDETGLPTGKGLLSAAQQTANALLLGTTAPRTPPSWKFWDAFDDAHAKSGLDKFSHVKFFEHGPDELEISHIQVDPAKRGQGIGNSLMEMVTKEADKHGVTLHASPASDADAAVGLDSAALREWYEKWGFGEPGGGDRMTRRPFADE